MQSTSFDYITNKQRVIVAADVATIPDLQALVGAVCPQGITTVKLGVQLQLVVGGPQAVQVIREVWPQESIRILYDAKAMNTKDALVKVAKSIANLGCWGFTVHASVGPEALSMATKAKGSALLFAVSTLLQPSDPVCERIYGAPFAEVVVRFAEIALEGGADGLICSSPEELQILKQDARFASIPIAMQGIRPTWATADQHEKPLTPQAALTQGVDYLIIGRPITHPPEAIGGPAEAARRIITEIGS